MINDQLIWPYWSVDLPGLTEASARRLLAWAIAEDISLGGSTVDPAEAFSSHLDRETVIPVLTALGTALRSGELSAEQVEIIRGFAGALEDWASSTASTD